VRSQLKGKGTRQPDQSRFGCGVGGRVLLGGMRRDGRDVDDDSATPWDHQRRGFSRASKRTFEVNVDDAVEVLVVELKERRDGGHSSYPCIVDQEIERSESLLARFDQASTPSGGREVESSTFEGATGRLQALDGRPRLCRGALSDHHFGAQVGKACSDAGPDACTPAGHEGNAPSKWPLGHNSPGGICPR
jgi:hypothetical protein